MRFILTFLLSIITLILVPADIKCVNSEPQPVPKPVYMLQGGELYAISKSFDFANLYPHCNLLNNAIKQYQPFLYKSIYITNTKSTVSATLSLATISIKSGCEDYPGSLLWPNENMDESYQIRVSEKGVDITANEVWGVLRALATFVQLAYRNNVGTLLVRQVIIFDKPRFAHRGYMLDTSRHFIPKKLILETLTLMAISKLNVFHWHIVDDQSFPYQSYVFPNLSDKGAFTKYSHVYTQTDIIQILHYARLLGIRVIPEFDSPGHSLSWGKSQPNLLTPCYSGSKPNGNYGPIDPTVDSTYTFLQKLFKEVTDVFHDSYVHLGGDEVDFNCWKSNPKVVNFTKKQGFPNDFPKLQGYYMVKLINIVKKISTKKNIRTMVWQEVFDNKNAVSKDTTIVHVWKGDYAQWQAEMTKVTNSNYKAVLSSCWYLNYIKYGVDWKPSYQCDPQNFTGKNKNLVIGGEVCMWSEFVDETNLISRSWPRTSVVAERLWSTKNTTDINDMSKRIEMFRCRLLVNGFDAETVNGPGTMCERPGHI